MNLLTLLCSILLTLVSAIQAIRAKALLLSAIYLAGASAFLSISLYILGAVYIAVIELSVGAGLVTVLFVFAINISGEDSIDKKKIVPQWLTLWVSMIIFILLAWLTPTPTSLTTSILSSASHDSEFIEAVWEQRVIDTFIQTGLIFAGAIGLLGILAEVKAPLDYPVAKEAADKRKQELEKLSQSGFLSTERVEGEIQ